MCQMLELCDVRKECCLYQVRRSPRAELHTTTRHSEWWRLCRRLIQVPSTSVVTVPSWQHTFITHIWPFFMLLTINFDFLMAEYLHLPCAHSLGLCIRLGPSQNHRSSPHCCWTAGCFWQQGHDECTENMKKKKRDSTNSIFMFIYSDADREVLYLARGEKLHSSGYLKAVRNQVFKQQRGVGFRKRTCRRQTVRL